MKWVFILLSAVCLAGCGGQKSLYEWGSYQPALLSHTKGNEAVEFETELRETIEKGEEKNSVPPGVYAELGYLLMNTDRPSEAIVFFEREKERFPESTVLMDKMIAGAAESEDEESANAS